ncbi:MAG: hypothetical protein KDK90_28365, partial [Leptospiraceae bacterium]|nr:hypothetical protein [Leptospiraceae bacterium]
MRKLLIVFLCFLQIQYLQADSIDNIGDSCSTGMQDRGKNAFVTFYGDSLGDLVDLPTHGLVGWDAYLSFYKPDTDWRIQNFAVIGWTTRTIYDKLKDCLFDKNIRANFRMSNTIAMEIGGNDMVNYSHILIFMPWKYWTYTDPITNEEVKGVVDVVLYNIKVLIYFFRHPLIDKNVLVMGNFPTLSYSPTLGHVGDYFAALTKMLDVYYQKWKEENRFIHVEEDDQKENLEIMQKITMAFSLTMLVDEIITDIAEFFGVKLPGILSKLLNPFTLANVNPANEDIPDFFPDNADLSNWYFKWIYTNSRSATTAASFGLYLMQPKLEALATEMRDRTRNMNPTLQNNEKTKTYTANNRKGGNYVDFLPLYHLMINHKDCTKYYQCWVANPILYRDNLPGHINHFGYYLWANALSEKLVKLNESDDDWKFTNPLKNPDGKIEEPPEDFNIAIVPVDETGKEVKPEEPRVDINSLLLLCFFFGS